jgi:hypothetical protein
MLAAYSKFVVALIGFVVLILHQNGVEVAEDVSTPVIGLLTAAGVYLFPNS